MPGSQSRTFAGGGNACKMVSFIGGRAGFWLGSAGMVTSELAEGWLKFHCTGFEVGADMPLDTSWGRPQKL